MSKRQRLLSAIFLLMIYFSAYIYSMLVYPSHYPSLQSFTNLLFISFVTILSGYFFGVLFNIASQKSLKKLESQTRDLKLQAREVRVLPQTKLGLWHTKYMAGCGVRLAVDDSGKKYRTWYPDQTENEFSAKLYEVSWIPFVSLQRYAVVPIKIKSKIVS